MIDNILLLAVTAVEAVIVVGALFPGTAAILIPGTAVILTLSGLAG